MEKLRINHAAVWVLVLLHQVIGGIWYSPFLFAEKWVSLTGKSMSDFQNAGIAPYFISIGDSVIMVYITAWLFVKLDVTNFAKGMFYAFLFWLGFLFVEMTTFNAFELRPFQLTLVNTGKSLVVFLVTGFVLGMWKRKLPAEENPSS